jgi:hypothetical protein
VNPDKPFLAQIAFELQQRPPDDVCIAADMHTGVITGSLDSVDIRDIQEQHLASVFHDQSLRHLRLSRGVVRDLILGAL